MKSFIRFPKTDFDINKKVRTPSYYIHSFNDDNMNSKYKFSTSIPDSRNYVAELGYEISYNLKDIDIIVGSGFRYNEIHLFTGKAKSTLHRYP